MEIIRKIHVPTDLNIFREVGRVEISLLNFERNIACYFWRLGQIQGQITSLNSIEASFLEYMFVYLHVCKKCLYLSIHIYFFKEWFSDYFSYTL